MTDFFDSGPLPDWKEVREWLGKDIPWKLAEQWHEQTDAGWLNRYMRSVLGGGGKLATSQQPRRLIRSEVAKNARHVVATLRLAPQTNLANVRLYASADRLRLTGIGGETGETIRLPCLIHPRTGKVRFKNGVLQARFRRRAVDRSEYELFIPPGL